MISITVANPMSDAERPDACMSPSWAAACGFGAATSTVNFGTSIVARFAYFWMNEFWISIVIVAAAGAERTSVSSAAARPVAAARSLSESKAHLPDRLLRRGWRLTSSGRGRLAAGVRGAPLS